ncbi:uncharacterized protein si:dkeyp-75h12.7 [Pseudorasbora parva]|uniref:uncharacterized protein si:dkeyp-75h12.7 n=1 Tax=Pseudorasbora parva TaxID=51549 RepID=UPI00351E23AC
MITVKNFLASSLSDLDIVCLFCSASWKNVSHCIQISRQSCDLSHVFPSLNNYNDISLTSEELPGLNKSLPCDPINDSAATFSPPNISISMDNGSLWVTVNLPCAPSIFCEEEGSSYEEEEEMACPCPIKDFKSVLATVTLYNKHNLSDKQTHTVAVMVGNTLKVEFGFPTPGQEYCAVANFTAEDLAPSPSSLPQCVHVPAKIESFMSLIVMIACAVLIALGLVIFLLWRHCASSERPLPRSLALLQDLELQNETFIDSCKAAPHNESSEDVHISVVSICDFTLTDNQSSYHNSQSLGNGYYTSPILHNPNYIEDFVESGELDIEVQNDEFHLFPSHPVLEAQVGCPYQNQREETANIPLSSVQVKCTQQDEMSSEDLERYGDVELFITEYETDEKDSEQIQTTGCSQKTEYI